MGAVILLGHVLILAITLEALILFDGLRFSQLTPAEFLELFLFSGLAYGIYRLTLWVVEHQLPKSLDTLESKDAVEPTGDDPE